MSGLDYGEPLIVDGKRLDGRALDEIRSVKIEAGVLEQADGSASVRIGDSYAIAAVYGPKEMHPKHLLKPEIGVLRTKYEMVPFSVSDRKRPGPDRRSIEISKVTRESLEPVVYLEDYPRTAIDVFIEILQADAGTRVTGITAASVALADAGIKMSDMVAACAAGKADNQVILDLSGVEDQYGQADLPVAYAPREKKITLIQMDGQMNNDEFKQALDYALKGCEIIHKEQVAALKRRYQ